MGKFKKRRRKGKRWNILTKNKINILPVTDGRSLGGSR